MATKFKRVAHKQPEPEGSDAKLYIFIAAAILLFGGGLYFAMDIFDFIVSLAAGVSERTEQQRSTQQLQHPVQDAGAPRDMTQPPTPGKVYERGVALPYKDGKRVKRVALTWDDGPCGNTLLAAEMMYCNNVCGTFFFVGKQIDECADEINILRAAGDEIGIHGAQHETQWKKLISDNGDTVEKVFHDEVAWVQAMMEPRLGFKTTLVRPPFGQGALTPELKKHILNQGFNIVLWSVDSLDSQSIKETSDAGVKSRRARDADELEEEVMNQLGRNPDGAIVLLHSVGGRGNHAQSITAASYLIQRLKAQDVEFVTVSELLGLPLPPPPAQGFGDGGIERPWQCASETPDVEEPAADEPEASNTPDGGVEDDDAEEENEPAKRPAKGASEWEE